MRHRTKTIFENRIFLFTKHCNTKTEKGFYTIRVYRWNVRSPLLEEDIRNHFDPVGNRGSKNGCTWKFKNRHVPSQLLTFALMKWSG